MWVDILTVSNIYLNLKEKGNKKKQRTYSILSLIMSKKFGFIKSRDSANSVKLYCLFILISHKCFTRTVFKIWEQWFWGTMDRKLSHGRTYHIWPWNVMPTEWCSTCWPLQLLALGYDDPEPELLMTCSIEMRTRGLAELLWSSCKDRAPWFKNRMLPSLKDLSMCIALK